MKVYGVRSSPSRWKYSGSRAEARKWAKYLGESSMAEFVVKEPITKQIVIDLLNDSCWYASMKSIVFKKVVQ